MFIVRDWLCNRVQGNTVKKRGTNITSTVADVAEMEYYCQLRTLKPATLGKKVERHSITRRKFNLSAAKLESHST